MRKKENIFTLKLDLAERGVLIAVLNELRNKRIEEGKPTEFVNEVFAKLAEN